MLRELFSLFINNTPLSLKGKLRFTLSQFFKARTYSSVNIPSPLHTWITAHGSSYAPVAYVQPIGGQNVSLGGGGAEDKNRNSTDLVEASANQQM
ncbi:hypothetical protein AMEX_G26538 [Astyanax mexicanus]|uniref:Uncharacterized protein n=1 Tax=Astyanax mexicanus TaxID=7994 RepID=A0A8T2KRD0_ASTMX|nr:hypothetical protein AMEX_G26538 [Astyanax mexicanus]